jgi:hypothetical protein
MGRAAGSGAAPARRMTPPAAASPQPVLGLARADDDVEIRRLLRDNALPGDIRISLEREPSSLLAAAVAGERHDTIVARERLGGRVLGMGSRSVFPAWVNGAPCRLGYLSQLRVDASHRRHRRLLAAGFALARSLRRPDEATFDITTVIADNEAARRLLERGLPGMPRYVELGRFLTIILPCATPRQSARNTGFRIERARESDLAAVAACLERNRRRYQFGPRYRVEDLRSPERSRGLRPEDFQLAVAGDRPIGCLALWDQTSFKQVVVRGYSRRLGRLRPWLNLVGPLAGLPRLPAPGRALPLGTVSHVAVDDDRTDVFLALLAGAQADGAARGHACVVVGLAARHPWRTEVERRLGGRRYESILYAVHDDAGAEAVHRLDGRLPHLELALL